MAQLSVEQLKQCATHAASRLDSPPSGQTAAALLTALPTQDMAAELTGRVTALDQAQAALKTEHRETVAVEEAGRGLRGQIHTLALLAGRVMDLEEVAGTVSLEQVEGARQAVFEGDAPSTMANSLSRSTQFLTAINQSLSLYPWLNHAGTLKARAASLRTEYLAFQEVRERELREDAEASRAYDRAADRLGEVYQGCKELVSGYLRMKHLAQDLMQTLFLDEDPRWAARLSDRKATSAADAAPDSSPATPATPPSTPSKA